MPPTLANFVLFYQRLVETLDITHRDDEKFKRFANRVLGTDYNEATSTELRSQLLNVAIKAAQRQQVNVSAANTAVVGPLVRNRGKWLAHLVV